MWILEAQLEVLRTGDSSLGSGSAQLNTDSRSGGLGGHGGGQSGGSNTSGGHCDGRGCDWSGVERCRKETRDSWRLMEGRYGSCGLMSLAGGWKKERKKARELQRNEKTSSYTRDRGQDSVSAGKTTAHKLIRSKENRELNIHHGADQSTTKARANLLHFPKEPRLDDFLMVG